MCHNAQISEKILVLLTSFCKSLTGHKSLPDLPPHSGITIGCSFTRTRMKNVSSMSEVQRERIQYFHDPNLINELLTCCNKYNPVTMVTTTRMHGYLVITTENNYTCFTVGALVQCKDHVATVRSNSIHRKQAVSHVCVKRKQNTAELH